MTAPAPRPESDQPATLGVGGILLRVFGLLVVLPTLLALLVHVFWP
jgi:hypothetical protein